MLISPKKSLHYSSGFGMIEVLVSLILLLTGLLGIISLITRAQQAELESYQRVQALVLLEDMASRINANRKLASTYKELAVGTSETVTCPGTTLTEQDACQWHTALLGAAEKKSGASIGAMIGARGCVFELDSTNHIYMVSVAWQGLSRTAAPTDNPACGTATDYGNAAQRRVVTTVLRMSTLSTP